ncbi:hypothetical protein [Acetonema longum]|uniref:Lipoprotein n=1 Tax=Acetonema longum DSM 6540 TaxID=1009370 RepID=F7NNL2_9FIRM|nr:hypothetical protein [Acetonema longum]EGO62368.1 hypothetical protein ALO_18517 [Acetonema longum DSM 6540]
MVNKILKYMLYSLIVTAMTAGCSTQTNNLSNGKQNPFLDEPIVAQQGGQLASHTGTNTVSTVILKHDNNIIYTEYVRVGDKIAGLTVKSIDRDKGYISVEFSGEIELTGECFWEASSAAGAGYAFKIDDSDLNKTPQLDGYKSKRIISIKDTDYAQQNLPKQPCRVRLVLANLLVQNLTVVTHIADLAKVIEIIPENS